MHARIDYPALAVPGALKALQGVSNAIKRADIPETTLYLVELRASQINGCGVCVDIHSRELKHAGEPDERINTVAVWRDASYFTDAERPLWHSRRRRLVSPIARTPFRTRCGTTPRATTTRRSSPGSWSRSPRSTPGIAST